jgi:DNA polymerase I
MTERPPRLVLIDGNNLAYRAFYALPSLTTSRGIAVQAVYGFTTMLLKIMEEAKPDYVATSFDKSAPEERLKEFSDYKAHRQKMPESLASQFPLIENVLAAFHIPIIWMEGHEADDCIGTLARQAAASGMEVLIVSGDGDVLQLVAPLIKVMAPKKGISDMHIFDEAAVREKYNLEPLQIIDLKAIAGDSSDNIPGVKGMGETSAKKLLVEYGSLDRIIENLDSLPERWRKLIEASRESALMSRRLATIKTDLPIAEDFEKCRRREPDEELLRSLFTDFEFHSLIKKLFKERKPADDPGLSLHDDGPHGEKSDPSDIPPVHTDARLHGEKPHRGFTAVTDREGWEVMMHDLQRHQDTPLAIFWIRGGLKLRPSKLRALCCALTDGEPYYIPLIEPADALPLSGDGFDGLSPLWALNELQQLFSKGRELWIHDMKEWLHLSRGFDSPCFDLAGAAHLLDPGTASPRLSALASRYLGRTIPGQEELLGKKTPVTESEIRHCALESIEALRELVPLVKEKLQKEALREVFENVEIPLLPVILSMERKGIFVDLPLLGEASRTLSSRALELQERIYTMAGEKFNINSPKQLGEILFGKLGLPTKGKTTQGFSTSHDVLQDLVHRFPVAGLVLDFKEVKKLQSTYADALPSLVNPSTGRLHTTFNPRGTATGRLSSSEPNLQNIPIRSPLGQLIRRAFRAEKAGDCLISADYSQIELRILAHLSGDRLLTEAFLKDQDIHARTASEVFGIPPDEVDGTLRRRAKEINFGIIYGMSAHGLAGRTGVSRKEAGDYIDRYLAHFSGVKAFIDETIARAAREGFVTTLMGRKRWLPDLTSRNMNLRKATERMAINTPVQGSAADLIKMAMITIFRKFTLHDTPAAMLLQVHDELIFEVPFERSEDIGKEIKEIMEHVYPLTVPLKVNVKRGTSWSDMEEVGQPFHREVK